MRFLLGPVSLSNTMPIEIGEPQFRAIIAAQDGFFEALAIEEKFDMVKRNYFIFEQSIHEIALSGQLYRDYEWSDQVQKLQTLNLHLMNYLSLCRTYVDHVPQHISAVHGDKSNERREFDAATNVEYDNCLGYRVMSALRNYVQHRGFPVHVLRSRSRIKKDSGGDTRWVHSVAPFLSVEKLKQESGLKASILAELDAKGPEHNLTSLVRSNMSSFGRIHQKVRRGMKPLVIEWERDFIGAQKMCRDKFGEEFQSVAAFTSEGSEESINRPMVWDVVTRLTFLMARNRELLMLEHAYITGEMDG